MKYIIEVGVLVSAHRSPDQEPFFAECVQRLCEGRGSGQGRSVFQSGSTFDFELNERDRLTPLLIEQGYREV